MPFADFPCRRQLLVTVLSQDHGSEWNKKAHGHLLSVS